MEKLKKKNFKCNYCDYVSPRQLNVTRHIKSVHLKEKVACQECGRLVAIPSLKRHSEESCPMVNECSNNPSAQENETPQSTVYNRPLPIIDVKECTIETKLQILTLEDGTKTLAPFHANFNVENLIVSLSATCIGSIPSATEIPQPPEPLIWNDIVLTPVDSPAQSKIVINLEILYAETNYFLFFFSQ